MYLPPGILRWLLLLIMFSSTRLAVQAPPAPATPLVRAHAHNDYRHPRPLLDSLQYGFCSVEADIYLDGDQLLVGHDRQDLKPSRTLESLYLSPLRARAKQFDGQIYPNGPCFTLMIDIKSEAASTWRRLNQVLSTHQDIISHHDAQGYHRRAVQVVISGNRDWQAITGAMPRLAGVDGRLANLDSELSAEELPWISDRWTAHFRWRGAGPMPPEERAKLRTIVRKAHAQKRRVRFWATPESPALWRELVQSDVDLINTDQLAKLSEFLQNARSE